MGAVNVARLKAYKEKLILFPKKGGVKNVKNGPLADAARADCAAATQLMGTVMPLAKTEVEYPMMKITQEMKDVNQRSTLRLALNEKRMLGTRQRMEKEKKEKKA